MHCQKPLTYDDEHIDAHRWSSSVISFGSILACLRDALIRMTAQTKKNYMTVRTHNINVPPGLASCRGTLSSGARPRFTPPQHSSLRALETRKFFSGTPLCYFLSTVVVAVWEASLLGPRRRPCFVTRRVCYCHARVCARRGSYISYVRHEDTVGTRIFRLNGNS